MTDAIPTPPSAPAPRTADSAVIALVLSIASWVVCPLAASIAALIYASKATKEIAASGGTLAGAQLVTVARVVAWINIIIMGLVFLGIIAAIAIPVAFNLS